jgi:hypothetical protein
MRPPIPRLAVLCLSLGLLVSCGAPAVSGFAWIKADGGALRLVETGRQKPGSEGMLGPARESNAFLPEQPRSVPKGSTLELSFKPGPLAVAGEPPGIEVGLSARRDGANPFLRQSFAVRGPIDRLVLTLPAGAVLARIDIRLVPGRGGAGAPQAGTSGDSSFAVALAGIREVPMFAGFELLADGLRISSGVSVYRKGGEEHALVVPGAGTSLLADREAGGRELALVVDYGKGGQGKTLRLLRDGASVLTMRLHPAGIRTALPLYFVQAETKSLELVLPQGVDARAFFVGYVDPKDAELADFGRVLREPPADPPRDFDLYRWDLLPSVLVLDFRNLAVQDAYLKRLAFFVEKAGYRGTLASDAEIAPLHGWNAHDYRPSDLAAFFEKARAAKFQLRPEELALRALLLDRGLLLEKGGAYAPGAGALISISRESGPYLRTLFLTHESTHGIFFVDPEYRAFVQGIWKAMDEDEKWFWRRYFLFMEYDASDEYLMANEYQAYLLQQPLKQDAEYFTKTLPSRLAEKHPDLEARLDAYMSKYHDSFEKRAEVLDAWLDAKYGFRAGRGASW